MCAVCGVVLVVVMAALPSLFISSQYVARRQSVIEMYKEVSVYSVVKVWPNLTWWCLTFVCRR